nr:hypothetical protein [uncultured Mediterranean phage uvMED]
MAYVGTPIDTTNQFQSLQGKRFSGDASTTAFTLDIAPSSVFDIEVFVENVRQDPNSAYSLSGTTLTFTGAPPSGTNNIYVVHQAKAVGTINPPDASVNSDKLTGNLVTPGTLDVNGQELILDADADTSITADTDDQIDFKTGGTDRAIIDSSGNVGIGTSSPDGSSFSASSSPVLDVSGTRPLIILSETDSNTKKAWLGLSSDQFFVGGTNTDTLFYTDNAERMRIDSSGKLMINTTSDLGNSQGVLHVKGKTSNNIARFGAGSNGEEIVFVNSSDTQVGSIAVNASSTSYNTSSDHRLKENVIDLDDATTRVKQLQPKRFNFITDADTTVDGFLAHEVSSIVPEAITGTHNEVDEDGNPVYQGIDQSKLVPLLTASLQEAIAKIETLETEMTALKARVTTLEE